MTLFTAYHLRAFCQGCQTTSQLFSGNEVEAARARAMERLRALGWAQRLLAGQAASVWYCPVCALALDAAKLELIASGRKRPGNIVRCDPRFAQIAAESGFVDRDSE